MLTSPQSQPSSSSEQSDSNIYEDLLSTNIEPNNNNSKANPNQIDYKPDKHIKAPNGTSPSTFNKINYKNKTHHKHHINYNGYTNDANEDNENINDENIARELAHHPCTPRAHKLTYQEAPKNNTNHTKNHQHKNQKNKFKNLQTPNFQKHSLKPITTPRPESVGDDSTDEDDDDDSDAIPIPDEDATIAEEDEYTLKQKEKWAQKPPSYHGFTTGNFNEQKSPDIDDENHEIDEKKQAPNSNSNTQKSREPHVRGAEYFPVEELDNRYEFVRYLGHGAYGYVAEGRHIASGKKVAIKKILKIFHNRIDAKRLLRELKILRVLRGLDSIVQLIDILAPRQFESFDQIILVFEFIDTDLSKLIQSDQYFTKLHVQYMLYQILLGLKFMHSLNIFHRDLKPANILVNEDVSLKICDFGLARCTFNNRQFRQHQHKQIGQKWKKFKANQNKLIIHGMVSSRRNSGGNNGRRLTQHVVTRWYRSPEVILLQQKREYLFAVDMWSVGCIFGELLQMLRENLRSCKSRKPIFPGQSSIPLSPPSDPFPSMDQLTVIFGIIGTPTPEEILNIDNERAARFLLQIPKCLPSPLKHMYPGADEQALSLLRGLLQFDVEKRITVDEALSHPFIQQVRDEQNEKKFEKIINKIKYQSNALNFEFEDIKMKMDTYRSLIIEEVLRYNKHLCHKSSDASSHDFV